MVVRCAIEKRYENFNQNPLVQRVSVPNKSFRNLSHLDGQSDNTECVTLSCVCIQFYLTIDLPVVVVDCDVGIVYFLALLFCFAESVGT